LNLQPETCRGAGDVSPLKAVRERAQVWLNRNEPIFSYRQSPIKRRRLRPMTKAASKKLSVTKPNSPVQQRLWLMYPPKLIKKPFIYEVGHKFKVVTNIRQASVTDEIGIVCLELDGARKEVDAAIKWLVKQGVNVEPVEIGVIAG